MWLEKDWVEQMMLQKKKRSCQDCSKIYISCPWLWNPEYTAEIKVREQPINTLFNYFFRNNINLHSSKFEGILSVGIQMFY